MGIIGIFLITGLCLAVVGGVCDYNRKRLSNLPKMPIRMVDSGSRKEKTKAGR